MIRGALFEAEVEVVQVLPNGYYIFLFQTREMALKILRSGQWMYKTQSQTIPLPSVD